MCGTKWTKTYVALWLTKKLVFFCHSEISSCLKCSVIPHGITENTPFFLNGNISCRIASTFHYGLLFGMHPTACGIHQENQRIVGLSNRRDSCDEQHYVNPIQICGNVGVCLINVESRQSENFLLLWCFSTSSDFQKSCKNSLIVYFITVILSLTNSGAYVKYSSMVAQWLTQ